jgi:hypothetical protein
MALSTVLDALTHVVYVPSRMKVRVAIERVGSARRVAARIFLYSLPFFFLLQLIGQPELDDRNPLVGARSLSTKVFKLEPASKSGLTHNLHLSLAVGSRLFTPGFYFTFVRVARQQDFVRTPLISLRSSRSPPRTAAA